MQARWAHCLRCDKKFVRACLDEDNLRPKSFLAWRLLVRAVYDIAGSDCGCDAFRPVLLHASRACKKRDRRGLRRKEKAARCPISAGPVCRTPRTKRGYHEIAYAQRAPFSVRSTDDFNRSGRLAGRRGFSAPYRPLDHHPASRVLAEAGRHRINPDFCPKRPPAAAAARARARGSRRRPRRRRGR